MDEQRMPHNTAKLTNQLLSLALHQICNRCILKKKPTNCTAEQGEGRQNKPVYL